MTKTNTNDVAKSTKIPMIPVRKLANNCSIPVFGLGVWQIPEGPEAEQSVLQALQMGYRLIDTASIYGNERSVGKAIARSGIPRSELFITTKLWNEDIRQGNASGAFQKSLNLLGLDYIDLYLIHWPIPSKIVEPWKALINLAKNPSLKSIGVSNYHVHHLEELKKETGVTPVINQVELHPALAQKELRNYCAQNNIAVQAWSPLMQGQILQIPQIESIAKRLGKTQAQVVLRWHIENDVLVIPKTKSPARMLENAGIFDFKLSPADLLQLEELDVGKRFGPNPDSVNF